MKLTIIKLFWQSTSTIKLRAVSERKRGEVCAVAEKSINSR